MPSLTAESQSLVQNDRSSVQDSRSNVLSIGEEFHGPGFRFVRSFLLVILVLVGCLLTLAGVLSWHFSMDMTVEGKGVIEPRQRHRIKAEIAGIIQQIHVRQGQQVEKGEPLVTLDDTDWRIQLQKAEKDLEVNQSQQRLQAVEGRTAELQILEKQREQMEQERLRLEIRLAKTTIRVPAAGTVLTGQLEQRVGDHLQAGETVLEVVQPDGWQARIMVKEIDLPKIEIGQPARLYMNAFPHTKYKVFEGTVEEVPAAPVVGNAVEGAVYPIKVSILDPQVWDGEQMYSLAYGMNAEVKVVVERGRIVELLWKKLLGTAEPVTRHDFYLQEPAGMASTQAEINL